MCNSRCLGLAKVISIAGFLVLLCSTYYLRSEVLTLNKIRFSADQTRSEYELQQLKEDYPHEKERYAVAQKNYQLQREHYEEMLNLYQTDYNSYVKRLKDHYHPPRLPDRPQPPRPPEFQQKLAQIDAQFRARKHHYFETTSVLNWVALGAAICLVGGLLVLIMFDTGNGRLIYFVTLLLSFVFMIGPSFHSIISAIVGFLEAPGAF
ncbi:MAG: hypothetical protein A2V70_20850 [Planctomycetes bacterium RBG_13_63_9]|nr:MAG: hypothetical protein A2V70_20850 [Planctomycetes bacterium RBG_13_63_9]